MDGGRNPLWDLPRRSGRGRTLDAIAEPSAGATVLPGDES